MATQGRFLPLSGALRQHTVMLRCMRRESAQAVTKHRWCRKRDQMAPLDAYVGLCRGSVCRFSPDAVFAIMTSPLRNRSRTPQLGYFHATYRAISPLRRPDRFDERAHPDEIDHALHVVSKHLQTHLRAHPGQRLGEKVRRTHPRFECPKRVFDRLAA